MSTSPPGGPIVSMLWPDQVEHFPDVVYGAHSHQEFLTLCEHALEGSPLAWSPSAAWPMERRRPGPSGPDRSPGS